MYRKKSNEIIEVVSKPEKCYKCNGQGYYEDAKGTARFCELCLSKLGEEQMEFKHG